MASTLSTVMTVIGARPQILKAALVSRTLAAMDSPPYREIVVHTGQHYDASMSDVFFDELGVRMPDNNLGVGSLPPATQVARMLERLDSVVERERPAALLGYGDTNSTLAAALCAMQRNLPFIHVEAGERIYRRWQVPEEWNRVIADHVAYRCLTATARARDYLLREGMCSDRVAFVGDLMYDLFQWSVARVRDNDEPPSAFRGAPYHLATLHRVENTTDRARTFALLHALDQSSTRVILPAHPRLTALLRAWGWAPSRHLTIIPPLPHGAFLRALLGCTRCITDSGGVTREAFFARKPCIIPVENSYWTDIVAAGWAVETGSDIGRLCDAVEHFTPPADAPADLFGDGASAPRIIGEVRRVLDALPAEGMWHPHGRFPSFPKALSRGGDFTTASYDRMLQEFQRRGYTFAAFDDAERFLAQGVPFVLLRHDVSMDPGVAVRMARREAEIGVRATYFFLLRSACYNTFAPSCDAAIREILALGHWIGLHCDASRATSVADVNAACTREAVALEQWFRIAVSTVSFHRPSPMILAGSSDLAAPRRHTYLPVFQRTIPYCSDSMGRWRFGHPLASAAFAERRPLHLLTHPIWFTDRATSAYDTLAAFVQQQHAVLERTVAEHCSPYCVGVLASTVPSGVASPCVSQRLVDAAGAPMGSVVPSVSL